MEAEQALEQSSALSGHIKCQALLSCILCWMLNRARCGAGGAAYLFYLSRKLAAAVAGVTALLWIVALCYGNFSRKAQRTYQDALAETNQACL